MIWKYIFAFLVEKPAPLRRPKPHYQVKLKEKISLKKDHPNICLHRKVMSYFRNLRWPLTLKIQGGRPRPPSWISEIGYIFATEADIGIVFFKTISALLALISYVIVILVGRTCLAVEEKMNMLILTFTRKFHLCTFFTDFFANVFYSALLIIVWEQIFYFHTLLERKYDWKRDMLRKRCFLMPF